MENGDAEEGEGEGEEDLDVIARPPCKDLSKTVVKIDHFDKMHTLAEPPLIEGLPNFRKINGFPVYGAGQPLEQHFAKVLESIPKDEKQAVPTKIKWYNMRQEPVVYLNGIPYAPRDPSNLHTNIKLPDNVDELDNLQLCFAEVIQQRIDYSTDGVIQTHKDMSYMENPLERQDQVLDLKVESLKEQEDIFDELQSSGFEQLETFRIPVLEEKAPEESCFDIMVESLKNEAASTVCVFSCQMGKGRTTLGMATACIIKQIQISSELRKMTDIGLVSKDVVDNLIKTRFEPPTEPEEDPFMRGEFDVIKELMEKFPETKEGKQTFDFIADINGPAPKGTGIQNLRECVIETKWKYDVAPEEKQIAWKQNILDFLERYFYLICFTTYALEQGPHNYPISFKSWMDARPTLRTMIENGKDKLEWYRQVDPVKLNTLRDLINSPNYKENLGKLVNTVYDFAFQTYSDLPRGEIKNNSMKKLAAKTLMEILPPNIAANVNKKLDEQQLSASDFVTLIGLVSYYGGD